MGPPSPRSYLAPPVLIGDPLSAVDVARFLVHPLSTQLQIIERGPLRPPSAAPSHMRASDALALYRRQVTGSAPQGGGGAGLPGTFYGSPDAAFRAAPVVPLAHYAVAAQPGAVPYFVPAFGMTGAAGGAAQTATLPHF